MDRKEIPVKRFRRQGPERITQAFSYLKRIKGCFVYFRRDCAASCAQPALIQWAPAGLAIGILIYFGLPSEPPAASALVTLSLAGLCSVTALVLMRGMSPKQLWAAPVFALAGLAFLGFTVCVIRTHSASAPIMQGEAGPRWLEGWLEREEAGPKLRRLVIRITWIEGLRKDQTPRRVQIAAPARAGVLPGRYISCFASLASPPAPVTPGGYDFARTAYFAQIGAVGFATYPCQPELGPAKREFRDKVQSWLAALRRSITGKILESTAGGSPAGFVAALATGDESGISREDIKAMQAAGLTHLLAVSGMNMTLVGGFVFLIVRYALSIIGNLPLFIHVRAFAAAAALAACAGYWALTGGSAATTRAFVMAAIAFGAIMIDRPAITMRGLAIAACCLLITVPEDLLSPGFQMSFAATMSLVAAFDAYKAYLDRKERAPSSRIDWIPKALFATALTTLVAGFATGPYSAYHFQAFAKYGFISNLAASPIIGLIVTPAFMLALVAAPFGLSEFPLRIAEWGAQMIIGISHWAQRQPEALGAIHGFHPAWLLIFTAGFISLCLFRGWARLAAIPCIAASLIGVIISPKPIGLINSDGDIVLATTQNGYLRSNGSPDRFEAVRQRQALGVSSELEIKTFAEGAMPIDQGYVFRLRYGGIFALTENWAATSHLCAPNAVIIVEQEMANANAKCRDALILTPHKLKELEGAALYRNKKVYRVEAVRARRGDRPWTRSTRDQL